MAKSIAKSAAANAAKRSKLPTVTGLEVFIAARAVGVTSATVLGLVKRMGAKAARDHYVAGMVASRLWSGSSEPDVILHKRALVLIAPKTERTTEQTKAYGAARVAWSRITADIGVRADKRGSKRGAKGPRADKAAPVAAVAGNAAPVAPIVAAPEKPAVVTFAGVLDECLAMVRSLAAKGKKHAGMQGFSGIAATIAQHTLPIEKAILAAKG